eukprot:scaffold11162_cov30-Phaeocystis_antarctica.AAC.1
MIGARDEMIGADEVIGALTEMIGARILGALQPRTQVKLHRLWGGSEGANCVPPVAWEWG